jgi:chromosome segregation ATPase
VKNYIYTIFLVVACIGINQYSQTLMFQESPYHAKKTLADLKEWSDNFADQGKKPWNAWSNWLNHLKASVAEKVKKFQVFFKNREQARQKLQESFATDLAWIKEKITELETRQKEIEHDVKAGKIKPQEASTEQSALAAEIKQLQELLELPIEPSKENTAVVDGINKIQKAFDLPEA